MPTLPETGARLMVEKFPLVPAPPPMVSELPEALKTVFTDVPEPWSRQIVE